MNHHADRNDVPSGDGVWDGHIATRDDDVDLSTTFWGATRAWPDTGDVPLAGRRRGTTDAVPRGRSRSGDRTGPIQRTRTHHVIGGDVDAGLRDERSGLHDEGVDVPLADASSASGREPSTLMHRLGLGRVDPFVVRIGVIVVIAVLLVPIALALRATASEPSVTTEDGPAAGAAPLAGLDSQQSGVDAPVAVPTAPTPTPSATAPTGPTVIDPSTLPPAPIINPDFGSTAGAGSPAGSGDAPAAASDDATGVTEFAAGTGTVSESAAADEPATRVVRSCPQRHTLVVGDSWFGLADRADVDLDELLRLNGATVETPLYPGAEVCLPAHASVPAASAAAASAGPATTVAPAPPPAYVWVDEQTAQDVIRAVWPDDLEERALAVAFRESRYDVTAKNYCCYGLFQIYWSVHRGWLADLGITSAEQLFDARLNATAALQLYLRSGGWGPWT
jgi:hypothetical protein